ncbi:flippase [Candidatus Woesearchaeota archaeon]|nr:flippase [Candidatus Woesearchaeota archaeon]
MTNYTKKALKNFGIIFFISLVAAFFGYLVRVYFARSLTVEEFGLFYAVLAFLGIFGIFKGLGMDAALAYFIPKLKAESKFKDVKNSIAYAGIFLLVNNIIFMLLVLAFADFLGINYFKHKLSAMVLVFMAIGLFIDSFVLLIKYAFQGFQKMEMFSSIDLVRMILILIFSFIFFKLGFGILSPVLSYILSPLMLVCIYLPYLYKENDRLSSGNRFFWDKKLAKSLASYGMHLTFLSSAGMIIAYSDRIMLTFFRSLEEVGIYSAVFPTAMLLWYIPDALSKVLLPLSSELWNKGLKKEIEEGLRLLYRYSMIIMLPASFLILAFSKFILELFYGADYSSGSAALQVLAVGMIFYSVHKLNNNVFLGMGKPQINTKVTIIGAIANIILNFLLIPPFGFLGASIATMSAFFLMMGVGFYFLKKAEVTDIPYFPLLKTFFASMIFLAAIYYLNLRLIMGIFIKIPLVVFLSGSIYIALLFALKLLTIVEIKGLIKRLKS